MGKFVGNIDLQVIPGKADLWVVPFEFDYVTDDNVAIHVKAGLQTDLASTPRSIWWLYPPFGLYTGAAIVHDQLYKEQPFTRARSDSILLEAMKTEGVSWVTRYLIYSMVRSFGWFAWYEHAKENKKNRESIPS